MYERIIKISLIGLAAACGGDGGGDMPVDGGTQADASSTAPTVMVSPSEAQKGVLKTQPLVLTFSEPMNTASVEAAWSSTSLPAAQMQFQWNTANTILTVDASAVLDYPAGGLTVDTFGYTITLDATATDDGGEALAAALTSTFETARDITVQIPATLTVGARTGAFDGSVTTTVLRVGDTPTNGTWRSFLTFPITTLPVGDNIVQWTSASLYARQASLEGTPYTDLGSITLGAVAPITAIDSVSYAATARHVVGFSVNTGVGNPAGDRTASVVTAVEEDHTAARTETTFRLQFGTAQDGGNDDDAAIFESARLDLRFLAK